MSCRNIHGKKIGKFANYIYIGTTAVGKTKLSLELAKELKAQLISADSDRKSVV